MFDAYLGPNIIILIFSIIFHEYAHGYMAMKCGDYTAKYAGRLTFNPIPHVDVFGTIILPLLLIVTNSSFLFGWAKPVPVNPYNYRNPNIDNVKVSIAGPISNLLLAVIISIVWILSALLIPSFYHYLLPILHFGLLINVVLAVFNLMPIPPLDGSHIVAYLLPPSMADHYQRLHHYGILLVVIFIMTPLFRIVHIMVEFVSNMFLSIIQIFI